MTIDAVIPLASLDPAWLTGEPDILRPVSAETQKPFALLRELLASRQLIAVGSYLSLTGADRVKTIRPEGNVLLAQDAYFPGERRDVELVVQPTVVSLSPKELDLGGQLIVYLHKDSLIEALEGRQNTYLARIQATIAAKATGQPLTAGADLPSTPPDDLTAMLQASLLKAA